MLNLYLSWELLQSLPVPEQILGSIPHKSEDPVEQHFGFGDFDVVSLGISKAAPTQVRVGIGQNSLCPRWTVDKGQSVPSCPFTST